MQIEGEDGEPEAGDLTICFYCRTVLEFDGDGGLFVTDNTAPAIEDALRILDTISTGSVH